jgi:hypothetical protein
MPVPQVNIQNGQITGGPLNNGEPFQWVNPTGSAVTLTACGNWCTADTYTVPAASGGVAGTLNAQVLTNPNTNPYAFMDPAWNAPGQPRITVNPWPSPQEEKEVA